MQELKIKKIRTAFAVLLLTFTLFSIAFSTQEINHECCGSNCQICFIIETSNINLKLLKISNIFVPIIFSTLIFSLIAKIEIKNHSYFTKNLIKEKIRINN